MSNRRRYFSLAGIVAIILIVAGAYILIRSTAKRNFMLSEPLTLAEVSRFAEIQFPPEAVLEDNIFIGGFTRVLYAKVRMPRSAVPSLLAQPRFKDKISSSQSALRDGLAGDALQKMHKKNWWPDKTGNYRAVDMKLRDTDSPKTLNMVVSLDDPQSALIYLYVYDG